MTVRLSFRLGIILLVTLVAMLSLGAGKITTVDVTAFGAIANDGKDDTAAVLAALEECKKVDKARLVFPKGKYNFIAGSNPQDPKTLLPLSNVQGLSIDGKGSELIICGVTGVFSFANCNGITIRNLVVDWARPPFSVGKVISVEENHFDVQVEPEYPVKGGEPVEAFMEYDPSTRIPMRHGLEEYYSVIRTELLREQVLRIHLSHAAKIKPGSLAVLRHKVYGHFAFYFDRCSDVKIQNVTVHTAPGMGLGASVCTNVTLERFRVVPRTGRPMSSTADATHFSGCKGTIKMEGCEFEGMGDDGANIKSGLYLSLKQELDDHTVLAQHNLKMANPPDTGDIMEISHVDDLIPYATARVKKAEFLPNNGMHRIEFDDRLPDALKEGDVFGNATRTPKVRIKKCQVRNNRARGMLIQTRDAIVEGCKFQGCTGPGIMVLTEVVYFFESIGTRDVTVRNCTFENCNYAATNGPGALCAMAYLRDFAYPPKPGVHKNVVFEENKIIKCDNSAIFAAGVDGITIKGNHIEGACNDPTSESGKNAIYVMSSKGARVEENTIDPKKQGNGFQKAVAMENVATAE
ncbi:MAG: right-handed parallel beta-helix repeat-containing protein [Armatimonadetes bacterium]|nr:right-handed parallel beta-helix repeat-containing protein [Armatimonadota bacterium]